MERDRQHNIPVIYILSSGHAGSTLLGLLLGSHSQICSIGEVHTINDKNTVCTCGKHPSEGLFWKELTKTLPDHSIKIHKKKKDFLLSKGNPYYMETGEVINTQKYRELYKSIYRYALEKSGKAVIVSSASLERVEVLADDPEIEPIVVHLVRDGRAVTWSYMKKYGKPFSAMMRWFGANIKAEIVKKRLAKGKAVYITYEELVDYQKEALEKILRQVKLTFEPSMLEFRNHEHHQIGGNRMRFSRSNEIKKDKSWRQKLPLRTRWIFNILFGWLNMYYKKRKNV